MMVPFVNTSHPSWRCMRSEQAWYMYSWQLLSCKTKACVNVIWSGEIYIRIKLMAGILCSIINVYFPLHMITMLKNVRPLGSPTRVSLFMLFVYSLQSQLALFGHPSDEGAAAGNPNGDRGWRESYYVIPPYVVLLTRFVLLRLQRCMWGNVQKSQSPFTQLIFIELIFKTKINTNRPAVIFFLCFCNTILSRHTKSTTAIEVRVSNFTRFMYIQI